MVVVETVTPTEEKKSAVKICPLSIASNALSACLGHLCAFYLEDVEACAVTKIAIEIGYVVDNLFDIRYSLK